jgi:hypothetical protein
MSWKKQSAFKVNTSTSSSLPHTVIGERPYVVDKEKSFKQVETETLKADIIESSLLMMNNKDMMITTDRLNIHTKIHSLQIPSNGPLTINNALIIDKNTVHIPGNLHLDKTLKTSTVLSRVNRLNLEPVILLDNKDYSICNHFMIVCTELNAKGEIHLNSFQSYTAEWSPTEHEDLYMIHFCVNANEESLVDIDIVLETQKLIIKLQSRYSSLSLLWVPEGKWLIHTLGYKTRLLDIE